MPRLRRLLITAVILIAAAAGGFMLWLNADATPQDALLATATPVPDAIVYDVDADASQLKLIIDSRFGEVEGSYEMGDGTVELLHEGDGWRVIANLTFDARTLDIGNEDLNTVMRRALDVDTYPNGIFVARSTSVIPDGDTSTTVDLTGQMELHGTVRDYTIRTTITTAGNTVTLSAQHVINADDFGISIPSFFADNELDTDMRITARSNHSD